MRRMNTTTRTDPLVIVGKAYAARPLIGTGKYTARTERPVLMASAMHKAVEAGREALIPRRRNTSASSPIAGLMA